MNHGQNRTLEIRPSGIVWMLGERWNIATIGFRCTYRKSICRSLSAYVCARSNSIPTKSTPPHNAADFLELAENCTFLDWKLTSAFNEILDGRYLLYLVTTFCIFNPFLISLR
jgi:hypothetical protein